MLRITTKEDPQSLTLRLEGRLEGPWVAVLAQCWDNARPKLQKRRLCVDLNGVTFVDGQGRSRLAEMHAQGTKLLARDIETKAMVAEIQSGRGCAGDCESSSHGTAADISERLAQLQGLQAELHEVNESLVQAARPLERLSEMDEKHRDKLADELRAGLARWESVTQRISQLLEIGSESAQGTMKGSEGESR